MFGDLEQHWWTPVRLDIAVTTKYDTIWILSDSCPVIRHTGPYGGTNGQDFDDKMSAKYGDITQISFRAGTILDQLQV